MNYLSLDFVGFVAAVFLAYYIIPKKVRWGVLLLASLGFYALFDCKYVVFLLFAGLSTYGTALLVEKGKLKGLLISLCILLNAGVWFYIKELTWALKTAARVFDFTVPTLKILVPVGISYFTLQAIAYLVDVAKGKVKAEKNPLKYLLFLSWFPAIVQGPISRYDQLMPQLVNPNKFSFDRTRDGLVLVLYGLVKKMVIADRLAIFANYCFQNYADLQGVILYLGAIAYSLQLYADFSGCVDICRGVSRLFGVELMDNFRSPYASRSIKEFWNRWHISLSSWLKDYIYIPLGGNRKGTFVKYLNIFIVFLVSGLWHGAGLQFFAWGLMHAAFQVAGAITDPLRRKIKDRLDITKDSLVERVLQTLITFHLVALAWIVFRSSGLATAMEYIKNMFGEAQPWVLFDGSVFTHGVSQTAFNVLLVNIVLLFTLERKFPTSDSFVTALTTNHLIIRWFVYIVLIFNVLLFGVYGSGYDLSGFLYGGF